MANKKNTGVLFNNTNKQSEKQPDFKGQINIEGKEFDIAAWKRTSEKGVEYLSLSVSEPYNKEKSNTDSPF